MLSDRLAASPGDLIRTREITARWPCRATTTSATATATNHHRKRADGSKARHLGSGNGPPARRYVKKHVTLGYAATIDPPKA